MPEYENKDRDKRSQGQQQGQNAASGKNIPSSASLETNILAHLGLLKETHVQTGEAVPLWQKRVLKIQQLAEKCDRTNVEKTIQEIEALRKEDAHAAVHMAAVRELGKIFLFAPEPVRWMPFIKALDSKYAEVQATAVQVLMSMVKSRGEKYLSKDVVDRLWQEELSATATDSLVRMTVIQLFGMLGARALPAISKILDALHDEDWQIRETAVLTLGSSHNWLTEEQRPQLMDALCDENYFVRQSAIIATPPDWEPVKYVLQALHAEDSTRRRNAARVLGQWPVPTDAMLDALRQVAISRQAPSIVRVAAILSLAQQAPNVDPGTIINHQAQDALLRDRDEDVRNAATILDDVLAVELPGDVSEDAIRKATGTTGKVLKFPKKQQTFPPENEGQHD